MICNIVNTLVSIGIHWIQLETVGNHWNHWESLETIVSHWEPFEQLDALTIQWNNYESLTQIKTIETIQTIKIHWVPLKDHANNYKSFTVI